MAFLRPDRTCDIKTKGVAHNIRFENSGMRYSLYVDDEPRETFKPGSILAFMLGDFNDYSFSLGGSTVVMAMRAGKMRVAVDGVYVDDGSEFLPVLPLPQWSTIFIALILVPPVLLGAGLLDLLIAVSCVYMCTHFILKNPDMKATPERKIVYCALVTLAAWVAIGFFLYMEGKIFS